MNPKNNQRVPSAVHCRPGWAGVAVLALCLAQAVGQTADSGPAAASMPASGDLEIPKGALGPEYVDGSFGFAVRPIAGAHIDRRKRAVEGRVQLAQFVRIEVGWSMAVRLWEQTRPMDVQAARDALKADLLPAYPDFQIVSAESVKLTGREAVRLAGTFSTEGQMWLRQQAVIPLRAGEHLIVLLIAPSDDREIATEAFTMIVESFRIIRTQVEQEQLDAALDRGTSLLQRVIGAAQPLSTKAAAQPVYLRLTRDDKAVGFIEMLEKAGPLDHKEGLQILQRGWMFGLDGTAMYFEESKFVSNDGTYDEWRNLSQTLPSKAADPRQKLVVSIEGGIRRNDQLVVEYIEQAGASDKQDKVIQVTPAYASPVWPLLLPRVVDLNKPELYAFSMYDSQRRGLILRTLRVDGPAQVQVGGQRVSAFKIQDSEGQAPPVSEIYVDEKGTVLRMKYPSMEMVRTTQAEAQREFGSRVKAAQEQSKQNAGPPRAQAAGIDPAGKLAGAKDLNGTSRQSAARPNPNIQQKTRTTPSR